VDLDLISFNSLAGSVQRNYYRKVMDQTVAARMAQAEVKDFQKHMTNLGKAAQVTKPEKLEQTGRKLLSDIHQGDKKRR
jgi:hypothetical protein